MAEPVHYSKNGSVHSSVAEMIPGENHRGDGSVGENDTISEIADPTVCGSEMMDDEFQPPPKGRGGSIADPTYCESEVMDDEFTPSTKPESFRTDAPVRTVWSPPLEAHPEQAMSASTEDSDKRFIITLVCRAVVVVCLAIIVAVAVVVGIHLSNVSNDDPDTARDIPSPIPPLSTQVPSTIAVPTRAPDEATAAAEEGAHSPTLDEIVTNGVFRCGVTSGLIGFTTSVTGGVLQGFEVDLCRAVAAAIFGPNFGNKLALLETSPSNAFSMLHNGAVHLLAAHTTLTMERDLYESSTMTGFTFSDPYLYDSLGIGGQPLYVDCASRRDTTSPTCAGLRICVLGSTTYLELLPTLFPEGILSNLPSLNAVYDALSNGICNVLAGGVFEIAEQVARSNGFMGNYSVGNVTLSREPLALATREDDPSWSDFVNAVLTSLMHAEEKRIGLSNAIAMGANPELFGSSFSSMFVHAVMTVGNYGEMYRRHLEPLVPRQRINEINNGSEPLIYSYPFGNMLANGREPLPESTLAQVRERGWLQCGVGQLAGFAEFNTTTQEWSGLDVDVCRAISAAIFNGIHNNVQFIRVAAPERFQVLESGQIDLLTEATTATLSRDIYQPSVKTGFSFGFTTFFDGLGFGGIPPFHWCADNLNSIGDCAELKICVAMATTSIEIVRRFFDESFIVPCESIDRALQGLVRGDCNAVAGDRSGLTRRNIREVGLWNGNYSLGEGRFSKEPLTPLTRQDDPLFSSFVQWVVAALFYAEEQGITQATASNMPTVSLFGNKYFAMFRRVVEAVGNYGEMYERNLGSELPRSGANQLNVFPFGPQLFVRPGF